MANSCASPSSAARGRFLIYHIPVNRIEHSTQVVAEPIMYRSVHLTSERQLRRFSTSVITIMEWEGRDVAGFIRDLSLTLPHDRNLGDLTWSSLVSLMFFVPQLRAFTFADRPIVPCILRCLVHFAAGTLVVLNVIIHKGGHITLFSQINDLPALEMLTLTCANTERWDLAKARPLLLERVTAFSWVWQEPCHQSMIRFLAASSFARGGIWALIMPQLPGHMASDLQPWISSHIIGHIALNMPQDAMLALADELPLVLSVHFLNPPPANLFDECKWPTVLHISVRYGEPHSLFAFLDGVLERCADPNARAQVVGHLRTVNIGASAGPPFTWGRAAPDGEDAYAILTGRLMYHAIELDKHGIQLLDSEGRDVQSYFSRPEP